MDAAFWDLAATLATAATSIVGVWLGVRSLRAQAEDRRAAVEIARHAADVALLERRQ